MKKIILLVLASSLFAIGIFYAVAEIYLYVNYLDWKKEYAKNGNWYGGLTIPSKNPELLWEYRANSQSVDDSFPVIKTNKFGFRSEFDYDLDKPPGTFRVSVVGDSVALGYGVEGSEVFTELLRVGLNNRNPESRFEVLNHGIDGYSTPQILEMLKSRVAEFEPDKVIYLLCLNDFDYRDSGGKKSVYFNKPPSLVWNKLEKMYRKHRQIDFHRWHFGKNRDQSFADILAMAEFLNRQDTGFSVVIVPVFMFNKIYRKKFDKYRLRDLHSEIGNFLETNSIDYIDMLPVFAAQDKRASYYGMDIWHPTAEGHKLIAQTLLDREGAGR